MFFTTLFNYNYYENERKLCVMLKNSDVFINIMDYFFSNSDISFKKNPENKGITWESFDFKYTSTLYIDEPKISPEPWFIVYNGDEMKLMYKSTIVHKVTLPSSPISSVARYYHVGDTPTEELLIVINS